MKNVSHILFPTDFSESCQSMAPQVATVARHFGARITLLHALSPYMVTGMMDAPVLIGIEPLRECLEKELNESVVTELAGLTVDRRLELGATVDVITGFAKENGVNLIMLPTRGKGRLRQLLLGSVAAGVLHDSAIPVWTSSHAEKILPGDHAGVRNILCAIDDSEKAKDILRSAADLAESFRTGLRVVHVIEAGGDLEAVTEEQEAAVRKAHLSIEALQDALGIIAPICVVGGTVPDAVAKTASLCNADLVVIGRGVFQERLGRLRSNAYGIIRQSPCSVLSF
jgi:nucleotide-binding universal stress UspA family protein